MPIAKGNLPKCVVNLKRTILEILGEGNKTYSELRKACQVGQPNGPKKEGFMAALVLLQINGEITKNGSGRNAMFQAAVGETSRNEG